MISLLEILKRTQRGDAVPPCLIPDDAVSLLTTGSWPGILPEVAWAQRPADPYVGQIINIADSFVVTWGAVVAAGGGPHHVAIRWNGNTWTLIGK